MGQCAVAGGQREEGIVGAPVSGPSAAESAARAPSSPPRAAPAQNALHSLCHTAQIRIIILTGSAGNVPECPRPTSPAPDGPACAGYFRTSAPPGRTLVAPLAIPVPTRCSSAQARRPSPAAAPPPTAAVYAAQREWFDISVGIGGAMPPRWSSQPSRAEGAGVLLRLLRPKCLDLLLQLANPWQADLRAQLLRFRASRRQCQCRRSIQHEELRSRQLRGRFWNRCGHPPPPGPPRSGSLPSSSPRRTAASRASALSPSHAPTAPTAGQRQPHPYHIGSARATCP